MSSRDDSTADPRAAAEQALEDELRRLVLHPRPYWVDASGERVRPPLPSHSPRFGHDLVGHSAGYIATWIRGDVDRLVQLQDRVAEVTNTLVPPDQLDLVLETAQQRVARSCPRGRSEPARSAR